MLSEERIRKMIRLADYEKGIGSSDLKRPTIGGWLCAYADIEDNIGSIRCFCFGYSFISFIPHGLRYAACLGASLPDDTYLWRYCICGGGDSFCDFTARIAGRAYDESRARVKEYYVTLMELEELYEKEGEEETL